MVSIELVAYASQNNELKAKSIKLSREDINTTVKNTIEVLESSYLFPEKGAAASKVLQRKLISGELYKNTDVSKFVKKLGIILRESAQDNYLEVLENNTSIEIGNTAVFTKSNRATFGTLTTEILAGNIGYLAIKHLSSSTEAALNIHHAFDYLKTVKALIIDLRSAEGDSTIFAQQFLSYFFDTKTTFMQVYYEKKSKELSLLPVNISEKLRLKNHLPIYILNSAFVSGGGELISYTLKHFDKAVILGETTMGVAYVTQQLKVSEYVTIEFPYATYQHPLTGSSWANIGVEPDFALSAKESFDMAYKLAKQQVFTH